MLIKVQDPKKLLITGPDLDFGCTKVGFQIHRVREEIWFVGS
jgi:hypothetical protein